MNFSFSFHPLFVVMCCGLIYFGYFGLLASYLVCLLLHETAHFGVAKKLGYCLNTIKIMPHGVGLSGNNVYFSYKDEVKIALAGPFFNLFLIVVVLALWWVFPITYAYTYDFYVANCVLFFVNLLPVYPLDGGRVFLAILSQKAGRLKALRIVRLVGVILSSLLIVLFFLSAFFVPNFTILFFGLFLFFTSIGEINNVQYIRVNNLDYKISRINKGITLRNVAVNSEITLYKLFSQLTPFSITNFTILDSNLKIVGSLSEKELNRLITIYPADAKLKVILG